MAEAVLKDKGLPTSTLTAREAIHRAEALSQIGKVDLGAEGFRSRSWDEFVSGGCTRQTPKPVGYLAARIRWFILPLDDGSIVYLRGDGVGRSSADEDAHVGRVVDREGGRRARRSYGDEVRAMDVVEVERGARVGYGGADLDMAQFKVLDMAQIEAVGGCGAKHSRLGILGFVLGRMDVDQVGRAATSALYINIVQLDVLDEVPRNAAED